MKRITKIGTDGQRRPPPECPGPAASKGVATQDRRPLRHRRRPVTVAAGGNVLLGSGGAAVVMSKSRKKADDLFLAQRQANLRQAQPLAARMRPRTLDEFVGQQHFLGPGKLLRRLLQADRLTSAIFYGPPGSGKTALAHVITNYTQGRFRPLNAAAGIKEGRELLDEANTELEGTGRRTVLL